MTTLVFRDGIMAADSMGNATGVGRCRLQKLFRKRIKGKEHVVGVCGFYEAALLWLDWYGTRDKDTFDRLHKLSGDDDFAVLIWTGKKLLYTDRLMRINECHEEYWAEGTGAPHAITAMDCGKSAAQAVQMAIKRDIYSGGRIQTMQLEVKRGSPKT